ncbi:MAG: DsbA family oxidoreductase [Bacteroidetes bacterium]|nr:DsbA family oxidoreductase [Bacteroidota bacterium]
MKIEIWSDIACPFCYIGKRRLEQALEQFEHKDKVTIEWKSYLLNPDLVPEPGQSLYAYLSKSKGWSMAYTMQANQQVLEMAREVGLNYQLDKVRIANTTDAHRIIQLAKQRGLDDTIEEAFFDAYFTKGADLGDHEVLVDIAVRAGISESEARKVLNEQLLGDKISQDIYESTQIGVRGVPFFVFDNKYGISGAQPLEVFTRTLNQVMGI